MSLKETIAYNPIKTVYVKLTNRCNLRCKHCYNSICSPFETMSEYTLEKSFDYIKGLAEKHSVNVILHGGEPMIYHDMENLFFFIAHLLTLPSVSVTATTNLMYKITEKELGIISMFRDVHSPYTTLQTSWDAGTTRFQTPEMKKLWEHNVKYIQENAFVVVQPIVCLTKELLAIEPADFFRYMQEYTTVLNFDRLTRTGRANENTDIIPTNTEIDYWLCKAYKENNENFGFTIPLFEEFELAVSGEIHAGCRARQCSNNVRTINPNGGIATCPNRPLQIIETVFDKDGGGLVSTTASLDDLTQEEKLADSRCYQCPYFKRCNGDCYQLSWDETGCPGMPLLQEVISGEYKTTRGKEND